MRSPVVPIWLGTCELTTKTVNDNTLIRNLDAHVTQLIQSYKMYKHKIVNPRTTTIVFLPRPFFELKTYNKSRHYNSIEIKESDQH